jgi:Pectate lyase superfamily protein
VTFSVRDFGARGDWTTDDTAAIQATIDAALGDADPKTTVREPKGPIHLPTGLYRVTSPLRIVSAQGVKLRGDGYTTRLVPVGTMDSVLDLNGVAFSIFEGFRVEGDGARESVANAIHYYWDKATAARSSTANVFRDVTVANTRCVSAFRVGKPGDSPQVDNTAYYNLYLAGRWRPGESRWYQHGFHLGTGIFGNIVGHSAYNVVSASWQSGVTVDATNYAQWGGASGQNGVDFTARTLAYFSVQGVRSEGAGRLFESIGRSSNDALYSLSDLVYSADRMAPDGEFVRMTANGNLNIRNLQVTNGGERAKILAAPQLSSTVRISGINCTNTLDRLLSGLAPNATAIVEGYYQSGPEGGRVAAMEGVLAGGAIRRRGADGVVSEVVDADGKVDLSRTELPEARPAPPRPRARARAKILRGQKVVEVEHGLGAEPAIEDVGVTPLGPSPVWLAGSNAKILKFRSADPAPASGLEFVWSATLTKP